MEELLKTALKWWDEEGRFAVRYMGNGQYENLWPVEPGWVVRGRKALKKKAAEKEFAALFEAAKELPDTDEDNCDPNFRKEV